MTPLFISFYTQDTPYEDEAAELAITLRRFDLPFDIHGVPSLGSWQANTSYKATFVRDMMLIHDDRPLVWLDADARVQRPPILFNDLKCDVAFHRRRRVELLSGTLYFAPTRPTWETVKLWKRECEAHPDTWDQVALDAVVNSNPAGATFGALPSSYVQIFDGADMGCADDAVILHTQKSRIYKRKVDSGCSGRMSHEQAGG